MLVRVLMVGDGLAGVALEDIAPEGGLLLERREVAAFWAAPGLRPFDLAIVAHSDLPADRAEAIRRLHSLPGKPEIAVLATALEDRETLRLLAAGCYAVVPTGQGEKQTVKALERLVSRRRDELAVAVRAEQAPSHLGVDDLLPRSPAAQSLLRIARRVAVSDTSLLLLGETGSGKEWLARALHAESRRSSGPFISINCGAIPESLLESELFGHEKGAFTGAVRTRRGYFERAHGGTLFLDEIGEMPPPLQVRLLHVLQDRTIQRLGSEESVEVDIRVIAATHRDLKAALEGGRFRQDLYYRLAVVTLTVPPLRDRIEDIPALAEVYLRRSTQKLARPEVAGFTEPALTALTSYGWPGNVRELINVIERAALLCEGHVVDLPDLPAEVAAHGRAEGAAKAAAPGDLEAWLDQPLEAGREAVAADFERRYLSEILTRFRGNVGLTARHAGIDPRTLYNKMRELGLRKEEFR